MYTSYSKFYPIVHCTQSLACCNMNMYTFFTFSQQSLNSLKMAASIFETAKTWEGFVQGGKDLSGQLTNKTKHLHLNLS